MSYETKLRKGHSALCYFRQRGPFFFSLENGKPRQDTFPVRRGNLYSFPPSFFFFFHLVNGSSDRLGTLHKEGLEGLWTLCN
jgi:hypothetical protein